MPAPLPSTRPAHPAERRDLEALLAHVARIRALKIARDGEGTGERATEP
jgi:hypothetical protein